MGSGIFFSNTAIPLEVQHLLDLTYEYCVPSKETHADAKSTSHDMPPIHLRVPVKCEMKQKRNRSKRNETKQIEAKQIETNRNK